MTKFNLLFVLFCCCFDAAFASDVERTERVAVKVPSEDEQLVQDLLDNIKSAVNNEDSKSYLSCMTKDLSSKSKKKVVLKFMNHDMEMELHKFEIMESADDSIEFVVKYTLYEDSKPHNFLSSVFAKKDNEKLLISKEEVLSNTGSGLANDEKDAFVANNNNMFMQPLIQPFGQQNCENGVCPPGVNCPPKGKRKKYVPVFDEKGFEVLEGISLFNDENGNPSPNGIMWFPPGYLFKKFPDKYGVPQCERARLGIE